MSVKKTFHSALALLLFSMAGTYCCSASLHAQESSEQSGEPDRTDGSADKEAASLIDVLQPESVLTERPLNNNQSTRIKVIIGR